jgi:proteasome lid subunit RPN8/RPN11
VNAPVLIRSGVVSEALAHARDEAPRECCGLLLGAAGRVERAYRARNALHSTTRYLVNPEDHFAALRAARADGLEVVGAYHSHPASPAEPSPRDHAEASYPGFLYLIVGNVTAASPDIRAYSFESGNFRAVEIVRSP